MTTRNCTQETVNTCDVNSPIKLSVRVQPKQTTYMKVPSEGNSSAGTKAPVKVNDAGSQSVSCLVCSRFGHAAMFNIFKCFCLAQRLFHAASLAKFHRCGLNSSYVCEDCVECLEVIEEVEIMKKEFVRNFLKHCTIEALSKKRPSTPDADRSKNVALGIASENDMDSVISVPKADHEPEVMFVGRLKRQIKMMPLEAGKIDHEKDADTSCEPILPLNSKKWRVDVLTSPNGLGGMFILDPGTLPTIRQLFTSHGLRRYWMLPPKTTNAQATILRKRRRCNELVQYLKRQTASKALLAGIRRIEDVDLKQTKKIRLQNSIEASSPASSVDQPNVASNQDPIESIQQSSHSDTDDNGGGGCGDGGSSDHYVRNTTTTAALAEAAPPSEVGSQSPAAKSDSLETMPKSPSDELQIIMSGEDSIEIIDVACDEDIDEQDKAETVTAACGQPIDDPQQQQPQVRQQRSAAKNLIEEVVERFLHIEQDEIAMVIQDRGEELGLVFESDLSATSSSSSSKSLPVDIGKAPPLVSELSQMNDGTTKTRVATKRVAPIIRTLAPKSGVDVGVTTDALIAVTNTGPTITAAGASTGTNTSMSRGSVTSTIAAKSKLPVQKPTAAVQAASKSVTSAVSKPVAPAAAAAVVATANNLQPQYAFISHATTSQQLMLVRNSDTGALIYVTPPMVTIPVQNICP